MQISINNQVEEYPTDGIQYFGELMDGLIQKAADEGDAVLTVRVNGEDVTGKDRTHLEELPLGEIKELEIQTGDPKALALSTLESVAEFHQQLLNELRSTAELFRLESSERSNRSFVTCIDGLQVFMHTLESCRKMLGVSFELLFVPTENSSEERTVAECRRNLFSILDGLFEAQTDQDWVLLADMLEYELIPALEDWEQVIQLVAESSKTVEEFENQIDVLEAESVAVT